MYSDVEIRTMDGKKIRASCYSPERNSGKVVIIGAAPGFTRAFYEAIASFFMEKGYPVLTFDYRGMGDSAPAKLKDCTANIHQWAVQDIDAVILYVRNRYPKQEIIYVGHSVGGEIVGLARASQYISKLVLVNSALSCKKFWPVKDKLRIMALKTMMRMLNKWFGFFPGKRMGLTGDLPKGVVMEWANWCNNPNGLFDSFPDNNYRRLRIPLLAFSFTDDWRCPPKAVQELLNRFAGAEITWHHLQPAEAGLKKIGYTGFFDDQMKTRLWSVMSHWINKEGRRDRQLRSWVVGFW